MAGSIASLFDPSVETFRTDVVAVEVDHMPRSMGWFSSCLGYTPQTDSGSVKSKSKRKKKSSSRRGHQSSVNSDLSDESCESYLPYSQQSAFDPRHIPNDKDLKEFQEFLAWKKSKESENFLRSRHDNQAGAFLKNIEKERPTQPVSITPQTNGQQLQHRSRSKESESGERNFKRKDSLKHTKPTEKNYTTLGKGAHKLKQKGSKEAISRKDTNSSTKKTAKQSRDDEMLASTEKERDPRESRQSPHRSISRNGTLATTEKKSDPRESRQSPYRSTSRSGTGDDKRPAGLKNTENNGSSKEKIEAAGRVPNNRKNEPPEVKKIESTGRTQNDSRAPNPVAKALQSQEEAIDNHKHTEVPCHPPETKHNKPVHKSDESEWEEYQNYVAWKKAKEKFSHGVSRPRGDDETKPIEREGFQSPYNSPIIDNRRMDHRSRTWSNQIDERRYMVPKYEEYSRGHDGEFEYIGREKRHPRWDEPYRESERVSRQFLRHHNDRELRHTDPVRYYDRPRNGPPVDVRQLGYRTRSQGNRGVWERHANNGHCEAIEDISKYYDDEEQHGNDLIEYYSRHPDNVVQGRDRKFVAEKEVNRKGQIFGWMQNRAQGSRACNKEMPSRDDQAYHTAASLMGKYQHKNRKSPTEHRTQETGNNALSKTLNGTNVVNRMKVHTKNTIGTVGPSSQAQKLSKDVRSSPPRQTEIEKAYHSMTGTSLFDGDGVLVTPPPDGLGKPESEEQDKTYEEEVKESWNHISKKREAIFHEYEPVQKPRRNLTGNNEMTHGDGTSNKNPRVRLARRSFFDSASTGVLETKKTPRGLWFRGNQPKSVV